MKHIFSRQPEINTPIRTAHPNGHFYSPVVNPAELVKQADTLWPTSPPPRIWGIDFNPAYHQKVLTDFFPRYLPAYDYPENPQPHHATHQFYTQNTQFSWLDARSLFVLLQAWRPTRMCEVGSGFSSLLAADVNHRFLNNAMELICIEPYPRDFFQHPVPGLSGLIEKKVQDVPLELFTQLDRGDTLFIDSSHVSKTGSDVNYLVFEVLPRLRPGVRIHFHDIFLPLEYPREWVLEENRSWNEQYLLRALLMYSTAFKVLFGCKYAETHCPDQVRTALNLPGGRIFGGGSFWIEKCA